MRSECKESKGESEVMSRVESVGLREILDAEQVQSMMEDFYDLKGIGSAIVDIQGNVLVAVGWQKLCTDFHRKHPDTLKNCIESDIYLSSGVEKGEFKLYKCKNHLWDMATPVIVAGKQVGNVFCGQFFSEGESPNRELFRAQARKYGFDEDAYLKALESVPHFDRKTLSSVMSFYSKLANMLSELGAANLRQMEIVAKQRKLMKKQEQDRKEFQQLVENIPGVFYRCAFDPHWSMEYISCEIEMLTGYRASDFNHNEVRSYASVIHPDDRERVLREVQLGVDNQAAHDFEYRVKHKNGTVRWVHERSRSVLSEDGTLDRIEGVIVDITARKVAEEKLRESEQNLSVTLHSIGDGVIVTDCKGKIMRMNRMAEKLTGWDADSACGYQLEEVFYIVNTHTRQKEHNPVRKVLDTGKICGLANHTTLISRDGSEYQIADTAAPIQLDSEPITGVVLVFNDITEKYRLEEEMRLNSKQLSMALDATEHAFWDWNLDTDETYFSPRYYTMLGYDPGEFPANFQSWFDLLHPDDREEVVPRIKDAVKKGEPFEEKFRMKRKDGRWVWISGRGKSYDIDDQGVPHRIVGVHINITV